MVSVTRWLGVHLHLEVNIAKSQVAPMNRTSFLGFAFKGAKVRWSAATEKRLVAEVRRLTNRNGGGQATDQPQLGRVDVASDAGAGELPARMDGVLRLVELLPTDSRAGWLDPPSCADVLLGAVAPTVHADQAAVVAWGADPAGGRDRSKLEGPLALVAVLRGECRAVRRVVGEPGSAFAQEPLDTTCSAAVNRLVRTRMPGGVGAGGEKPPATRLGTESWSKAAISRCEGAGSGEACGRLPCTDGIQVDLHVAGRPGSRWRLKRWVGDGAQPWCLRRLWTSPASTSPSPPQHQEYVRRVGRRGCSMEAGSGNESVYTSPRGCSRVHRRVSEELTGMTCLWPSRSRS